ncbi:MAG: CDP-alcohol phosphatidyltransferase family protein [Candidatus Aenigmatarchaeota archaeon]
MLHEIEERYGFRKKIMDPFLVDVDPNLLSVIALLVAFTSGYLFLDGRPVLGGLFLFLNGFLDLLDGEVAKEFGRTTDLGDFLDHTFDRLADAAVFLGVALGPVVPMWIGSTTVVLVVLVSYLGVQFQALTRERLYSGLMGRSDRIVVLFVFAMASYFFEEALLYGIYIISAFSAVTFIQRFYISVKEMK